MFTTPTGQTGRDAYIYETVAIANAQRKLDERMARLVKIIREEDQDLAFYTRNLIKPKASSAEELCDKLLRRPIIQVPKEYADLSWDGLDSIRPDLARAIADGAKPIYI
jgi:hypothetical protein